MIGLSEAVRAELRGTGVEVTVVMPGFAKTELASGVPDLRGVPRVSPEDIAAFTIDALKVPRFDVWAPKRLAAVIWSGAVMPRRVREAVSRAMNSNRVVDTDPRARAAYEERAAPRARPRRRKSWSAEPVGDQGADLLALILLQEVAGALDQPRRRPAELGRERLAAARAAAAGPPRPTAAACRGGRRAAPRASRARARGLLELEHERRERPRARLAHLVRERRVVGGGDLVARDR